MSNRPELIEALEASVAAARRAQTVSELMLTAVDQLGQKLLAGRRVDRQQLVSVLAKVRGFRGQLAEDAARLAGMEQLVQQMATEDEDDGDIDDCSAPPPDETLS